MPAKENDRLLTRQQIHLLVPHERRNGQHQCPVCHLWHFTIEAGDTPDFSCKTPGCQGETGHDAIVKKLWAEVRRQEEKLQKLGASGDAGGEPSGSLSLVEYAMSKNLPIPYLEQWFGVTEGKHPYYPGVTKAVCFPYWDENGNEVTQQWRWGMGKDSRACLAKKSRYLYGGRHLQRLEQMAADGNGLDTIFLVEGESNTHTLSQRFPTLGLPAAGNWKQEWADLKLFQKAKRIYLFLDMRVDDNGAWLPEEVAIKGARKVAESFPPGKVLAVKLPCKDVSDLWCQHTKEPFAEPFGEGPDRFLRALNDVVLDAQPVIPASKLVSPVHEIELVSADEIEPTLIEWLWPDRIPLGKFTLFYGLPDQGKSTVVVDIISRGSTGREFSDRSNPLEAFDTIVLTAEDDPDDTYVPRLMVAGADLKRVHFAQSVLSGSEDVADRAIALDRDLHSLERLLEKHPATRLLVVDPISAYLGEKDQNKDKEVRPLLFEIRELSRRTRVTVIGITHFNKNSDQAAIHRASGAGAWTQVPRALWAFVPAPVDEENTQGQDVQPDHLMLNAKLNIARDKTGFRYGFDSVPVRVKDTRTGQMVEATAPRIKWLGKSESVLDDVMKESKHTPGPEAVKTEKAMDWLREYLADEAKLSDDIFDSGESAGHRKRTLYEAKKRLGIKPYRPGGNKGPWWWQLPETKPTGEIR